MGVQDSGTLHLVGNDAAHKVGVGAAESGHEVVEGFLQKETPIHHMCTLAGVGGHHVTVILCRIPHSSGDTHIHVLCVHMHYVHSSIGTYVCIHTMYTLV